MKQGDKIKFPCGASAEIELLEQRPSNPDLSLTMIKLHNLAYTEFDKGEKVLRLRFQNRAIPIMIEALTAIQRELNK